MNPSTHQTDSLYSAIRFADRQNRSNSSIQPCCIEEPYASNASILFEDDEQQYARIEEIFASDPDALCDALCLQSLEPVYGDELDRPNPYELFNLIHMQDEEAYCLLFEQLKGPINDVFYKYVRNLMSLPEWYMIAYEVFDLLVCRYRPGESANLSTFFYTALRNRVRDYWRMYYRKGASVTGKAMPIETMLCEMKRSDRVYGQTRVEHESDVLIRVTCDEVCRVLYEKMSPLDYQIIIMFREGYTKTEIQKILDIPYSGVNTALRHARSIWVLHESSMKTAACHTEEGLLECSKMMRE